MFYVAEQHPDVPEPGHVYVSVGSLTSNIAERPAAHVSYEERVAWHEPGDPLPKLRGKTTERIL